jgi:uncharacterized protein (TIGR02099 family)
MSPLTPDAPAAARRWARKGASIALGVVAGAWSILLVAWLTLYWGILPNAGQWRPQLEQWASRALGVPVAVGRLEVRSHGWVPTLELGDVVLHDAQGRESLRLPRVIAALSARSLLAFELRFRQLYIEGAALELRRGPDGRFTLAGIAFGEGGDSGADWLLAQHEILVRHASLRYTDEQRGAPPLALSEVDVVLRNGLRRHDLRLDATPPPEWGERLSLRAHFTQPLLAPAGDWRRYDGTVYADLPRADVRELRRHVALPFELSEGDGALRAWLDVRHGALRGATLDIALRTLAMQLAPDVQPLQLASIEGRLAAARDGETMSLSARRLSFVTGDGLTWPQGDFALVLRDRAAPGGEFGADRLDLAVIAEIAARVPLPAQLRTLLGNLRPQGVAQGLAARWDGPLDAPPRYQARGRVLGLSIAAGEAPEDAIGRPGWRNATFDFDANERGGSARLNLDGGQLEFPGVFADPLVPVERLAADLAWRIEQAGDGVPAAVELKVSRARFANADGHGELSAVWRTGKGRARFPGSLDLAGRIADGRAVATARYLPLGIPAAARDYVGRAVLGGRIVSADFKVQGELSQFPFGAGAPGVFRIAGRVDDATLAYVPGDAGQPPAWPAFTRVAGELVFDRTSMAIRNARARLWGVELANVDADIPDLVHHPTLSIGGQGRGPLDDLVRYVDATPVGGWIDGALEQARAAGDGDFRLALTIPLDDVERSTVKGSLLLPGNDVRLRPDTPLMAAAKARVEFTHKTLAIIGGSAKVLGGDATFEGGSAADGSLRFSGQGMATADGLKRAGVLAAPGRLAASLAGQAPYRLQLSILRGRPEFTLTSTLVGLSSELPAPLRKSADVALPLRVQLASQADGGDILRAQLGALAQASYVRDASGRVLRGAVAVGDALPSPAAGVQAAVSVAAVDADAWDRVLDGIGGADAADGGYLPSVVAFRAGELTAGARTLTGVVAGVSRSSADGSWRASVEADQLGGYIELQPARGPAQPGRIYARLARLALPPQPPESVETLLEQAPGSAPALDIVVDDFELRGRKLGRVEIEAVNRAVEGVREWQLSRFNLATPEARLAASGRWGGATRRRMVMDFQLELADSGAFAERLGGGHVLRGGKGRMTGQVSWSGSPLALHLPSLAGQMNLALDAGQFLKAGPGAARLLSVLSLQSLPRRLALDFRDLFQEGFAFDNVSGDITIHDGIASTNNLRLRGVQAAVLMEGRADLARETQDLRVIVVPEINAGTASLAYAAINPAVGLGTFVAQLLLRKPLMAAGTREFHITGDWAEPKVERVERRIGAPLPEVDNPAAAASAPQRNP